MKQQMIIQICVGSSCHLKGSEEIVRLLNERISESGLQDEITLAGSFCIGKCSRTGVTIQVDDEIVTGVTVDGFDDFYNKYVLKKGE